MAGANTQQYGIKNWRIYREPIDGETVHLSYKDIKDRLITNTTGDGTTLGTFYGGLITSVTSDSNKTYNGPWYISYNIENRRVSYLAERIPVRSEIDFELYSVLEKPKYTKPEITVQFLSATNGVGLTTVSKAPVIYEDIEVMSSFTPGIKINWPERTSDNKNGTRAYDAVCNPSKPKELLGYSYGVAYNSGDANSGISFWCRGIGKTASYNLNTIISFPKSKVTTEGEYVIFDNLQISYLPASYMYYPQFYDRGRFEISYGEGETAWFGNGIYIPDTVKYVINVRWKYYWGLSDKAPENEQQLKSKKSGLLNNSNFENGTTTSTLVGEDYNCKSFWIAFPPEFALVSFTNDIRIQLEQPDGTCFDLISETQNMKLKKMNVHLGDNITIKEYNVAFFDFEWPIGNKSAIISFRIVPAEEANTIYKINFEDESHILTQSEDNVLRTESSNNVIYGEDVLS